MNVTSQNKTLHTTVLCRRYKNLTTLRIRWHLISPNYARVVSASVSSIIGTLSLASI